MTSAPALSAHVHQTRTERGSADLIAGTVAGVVGTVFGARYLADPL